MRATSNFVTIVNGTFAVIIARDFSILTTFNWAARIISTSVRIITIYYNVNTAHGTIATIIGTFRVIVTFFSNINMLNSSVRVADIIGASIIIINWKDLILATFFSITTE
jgi:hypothetical protein